MATSIAAGALLTIVVALLTGLIGQAIKWLTDGANAVVEAVMNSKITDFGGTNGNLLSIFEEFFNDFDLKIGNNIAQVIMIMSFFLILLFMMFDVINSLFSSAQGEASENPAKILIRGIATILLEVVIFGLPFTSGGNIQKIDGGTLKETVTSQSGIVCSLNQMGSNTSKKYFCEDLDQGRQWSSNTDETNVRDVRTTYTYTGSDAQQKARYFQSNPQFSLIGGFGHAMSYFLDLIWDDGVKGSLKGLGGWYAGFNIPSLIVVIILSIALFKSVIQMAIVFIERYLSFAFYILMGPLAVACNATTKTRNTFHDWLIGVLSQFLTIFISLAALRMYYSCWVKFTVLHTADNMGTNLGTTEIIFYCVCLALTSLVANSEKIVNALGFRTIVNGDTARAWQKGSFAAGMAFRMTAGRALTTLGAAAIGAVGHNNAVAAKNVADVHNNAFTRGNQKVANLFDPYRNTQVGMSGNKFHNSNYSFNQNTGKMEHNGLRGVMGSYIDKNLNTMNNALEGKNGGIVKMKDVMDVTGLNSVANFGNISENGQVFRDASGNAILAFKASAHDANGQLSTRTYGISLNGDLDRGTKLTSTNDLANGVYTKEVNTFIAHTDSGNGMTLYQLDNTKTLSSSEFKAEIERGNIDGEIIKDGEHKGDVKSKQGYFENAEDYNDIMIRNQEATDAVFGSMLNKEEVAFDNLKQANELKNALFGSNKLEDTNTAAADAEAQAQADAIEKE